MHAKKSPSSSGLTRRALLGAAAAGTGLAVLPGAALAQANFPSKPITLMVPFAPGGIADITARAVAEAMGKTLGQTIVIDNRPSAGSIVATQAVAKAQPDGHTLLLMSNANAVSEGLFKKLPYDITKDVVPVTTLGFFDLVLAVDANSRFKSLKDLVAYAKANPGKLTIGTIAIGSTQHLSAELFKTRAGIDALVVPYKASPAVLTALRSGEIDVAFEILGPTLPQITGGAVRALAVTSSRRNATLPDVPTVQEAGVPQYDVASWNALAAPAGTPKAVIDKLNAAAREAVASPAVQQRMKELGMRGQTGTPAEQQALLASEIKRWREVITAAKIQPE
ncbi:Bug family tripartite tricarboxylate transporter substrate binding protein [Caldimonas tepidiphila]|uniref:Bug family tripartite tricarboxylate transporter substrate binding protein n=1 Tax=Caldimonas tepidiphila TaxID=2315841 RepID=UPI000E5C194F|nr:tripartite tricarboxylate transporter substrate binding protein [Caldimonas tepidiphila]